MAFEEFFNLDENIIENKEPIKEKININQVYDVITSKKPDWQVIIYELISSEQLDPWDIDIIHLTNKYFEKILEIEDTDYYISSKVVLAASLLLRIKSELLLNKHIRSIDEILFGKKDEEKKVEERIEIDDSELPFFIPKTPLPRLRKITLNELMEALNKAINTESRRIKREIQLKRAFKLAQVDIPKFKKADIKDRIKELYARILTTLNKKNIEKIPFSILAGSREQKLSCFLPILHLSTSKKLWLKQTTHLDEIWIYLYKFYEENRENFLDEIEKELEEDNIDIEQGENLDDKSIALNKARKNLEEKKKLEDEIKKELEEELGEIKGIAKDIIEKEEVDKT